MSSVSVNGRKRPLSQPNNIGTIMSTKRSRINDSSGSTEEEKDQEDFGSRSGSIARIVLKNFMCHTHFEVNFTRNATIVVGRNGSGKSAVLTALIVGLGGKASLTNRGTSVKGFVKAGTNSGSVEIELFNEGPSAYRSKTYGNRIKITRTFTANGGSGYKIKNENGETVSSLAKEIRNITSYLNIQIENPICILNQDTSRNFLNSNDPKQKFALFLKATGLEKLKENYEMAEENIRTSVQIFQQKQRDFQNLEKELKNIKIKIDNHRNIVNIQDRIKLNQIELLWSQASDLQNELKAEEKKVEVLRNKYEEMQNSKENRGQIIEKLQTKITELRQKIDELRHSIEVQSGPQNEIRTILDNLGRQLNEKKRAKRGNIITIEARTRDVTYLEKEIANVKENMSRVEKERMERLHALESKEAKIRELEERLQTVHNDLYQFRSDSSVKEEQQNNLNRNLRSINTQIHEINGNLQSLKNESGNMLLLYGSDMPRVLQMIEQNRSKFKHMPRGPLGNYVKLTDRKWAVAVEGFLGALLNAFAVDNRNDNKLLNDIFDRVIQNNRKPTIITSKFFFKVHDVSPNLVQSVNDCPSLFSTLLIDDPVVTNCLIDQAEIEGVLLFPNNERAMHLMSDARNVPRNCRQGITIKGDRYYPDPDYRTYGSMYHRAKYLQVDTKQHIKQLEEDVKNLAKEKQNVLDQLKVIEGEITEQANTKKRLEEKTRALHSAKIQLGREIDELRLAAEPSVVTVESLERELGETKPVLMEKMAENEQIDKEIVEIEKKIADREDDLKQLRKSNEGINERVDELDDELQENLRKLKETEVNNKFDKKRLQENEEKLRQAEQLVEGKRTAYNDRKREASDIGEEPESIRNVGEIVAEIQSLERSVRRIQGELESAEVLLERYSELKEKYLKVEEKLVILSQCIDEVQRSKTLRSRHYKLTERYLVGLIKHSFQKMMEVRQFEGSIDINMDESKLELHVIPQQGAQGAGKTTTLSGGEKSFSTVAFLYSLWQCVDFPFYFLDEFDVYMDKLNRTKVIEIMLKHTEAHPSSEYVFLTPQDISFISQNVSILRLPDPERRTVDE